MLALTKQEIGFETNQIHIQKTYYRDGGQDYITTPKTEESIRTIDIPIFLKEEIKTYYERLYVYEEDMRLFPITLRGVEKLMERHTLMAGVKKIEVHSLRHSAVAYLIHQGVPAMIIKERLGHKDIRITLNTYGHLYPSEQKKIAELMDKLNSENQVCINEPGRESRRADMPEYISASLPSIGDFFMEECNEFQEKNAPAGNKGMEQ